MYDVISALKKCYNTAVGPNKISFATLKKIASQIDNLFQVIFQQSLHQGVFPEQWKRANVMPLYTEKGELSNASSYRPISLCSCIGKLLEKIVKEQIQQQIAAVRPISSLQHGFSADRSTLTNLLA